MHEASRHLIYTLKEISKEFPVPAEHHPAPEGGAGAAGAAPAGPGKPSVIKGCDRISLEIEQGDFVAITGHSGSGKSTLLSLLGFLATPNPPPRPGQFVFTVGKKDHDLAEALEGGIGSRSLSRWRADHIGFVFQSYHLLNHLTGRANVELGLRFAAKSREDVDRPEDVLHSLDMSRYADKSVRDLSGGQKQRISVARALVKRPDVILADEPTGNLDIVNKCLVLASLIIANTRYRATVVLVTHEIEHPPILARRSLKMSEGRVVADRRLTPKVQTQPGEGLVDLAKRIGQSGYPDEFSDLIWPR